MSGLAILKAGSHQSQVPSLKALEVNLCNLNRREDKSWDLPLHTGSQVLSSKYDINTYIITLLGGEVGTYVESCVDQRAKTNSQHKSCKYFCINNQDPTLLIINHILMDFLGSRLGLCLHVGTC